MIRDYLKRKGYRLNDSLNIFKFRNLPILIKRWGYSEASAEFVESIKVIYLLSDTIIIKNASCYFWFKLNKFYYYEELDKETLARLTNELIIALIDSFAGFLPIGFSIRLTTLKLERYILPSLGKALILSAGNIVKYSANDLIVCNVKVSLNEHDRRNSQLYIYLDDYPFLQITPDITLVGNEIYTQDFVSFNADFPAHISAALKIVESVDQSLFKAIVRRLRWIIYIQTGEKLSFTDSRLDRTIFISYEAYEGNIISLASTIIHEFSHLELAIALRSRTIFVNSDRKFYSPWRYDSRPIHGLIHGIYVFTQVFKFLSRLKADQLESVKTERQIIFHQLKTAFDQIQSSFLTEFGKKFMSNLEAVINAHTEPEFEESELPEVLAHHKLYWDSINSLESTGRPG